MIICSTVLHCCPELVWVSELFWRGENTRGRLMVGKSGLSGCSIEIVESPLMSLEFCFSGAVTL